MSSLASAATRLERGLAKVCSMVCVTRLERRWGGGFSALSPG